MKRMLFLFLLIPVLLFSQEEKYKDFLIELKPDSTANLVLLPALWRSDFYKLYKLGRFSAYTYVVNSDSVYYKIFSRYHKDSLPSFDFAKQELLVRIFCPQCVFVCNHSGRSNEPCHRNACSYRDFWYFREKN